MQIIEISDPLKDKKNDTKDEIAVGIDFGTTNSLIAFSNDSFPYVIEMIPSIVGLNDNGKLEVMDYGVSSVKRLLGKGVSDIQTLFKQWEDKLFDDNGIIKVKIDDELFTPVEISSVILSHLKLKAQEHLNKDITKAVITVPAHFDDAARNAVLMAARLAGIEVLRLINEPTAAAFAYGLDNKSEGIYLVYDFGGGTFDVSILNMTMGVFQVLSVGGDNMLGGDDIDLLLHNKLGNNLDSIKSLKEKLSYNDNVDGISKEEFNELISPLIKRTIEITEGVLKDCNSEIKGIILVGGSTKIPFIKEELSKRFSVEILDNLDPDRVVSLGAALQAENLTSKRSNLLLDVVPLSLGIELMGGINEKIIMRNTPIPTSVSKEFTTYVDNQTAMSFHIVQGEREMAEDCRSLAKFELRDIPPLKAGVAKVKVTFVIDADGIVSISAKEENSGREQFVHLKPTYGITTEDAISMLQDAFENAEEDHNKRYLKETILKAEDAIRNLSNAIKETPSLLSDEELLEADYLIANCYEAIKLSNRENIISKLDELLKFSEDFAMRRLNEGILHAIKGKNVDDFYKE